MSNLNCKMLGISLPSEILLKIDEDRGLIPRSRYLLKLIEIAYKTNEVKPNEFRSERKKIILSDVSPPRPSSDKIKILTRRKPYEYI